MDIKVNEGIRERIQNSKFKLAGAWALCFVAGFLLGIGRLMGEPSPFAVALVSVSKKRRYIPSALGAGIGYLLFGITPQSVRYLSAVFVALLGAIAVEVFSIYHLCFVTMLISGAGVILSGIFLNVNMEAMPREYLVLLGEGLLSVGTAYFYYKSLNASLDRLRLRALPIGDLVCIVLSVSTLFLCLSSVHIGLMYPVRALAILLTLFAIRFEGERWGTLFGVIFGFVLAVQESSLLFVAGALSFSALVAGVFTNLASLGISVAYLCALGFFCILSGGEAGFSLFVDGMMGAGLFLITPSAICDKIEQWVDNSKDVPPDGTLRQNLVLKLRFASSAMAAISDSVDQVREKINDVTRRENLQMKEYIGEEEYITKEIILEKTNQIRMVASDQFFSISDMLKDLASEFDEAEVFDAKSAGRIRRFLGEYEIYPTNLSVVVDKFGRMRVEILTKSSPADLINPRFQREIGRICNRFFDTGSITNFSTDTMLSFCEKPIYTLKVGSAQHSAEGELCGDTIKVINDSNGRTILIISDGMGKGSRAALDGAMGAGLLAKLLNAGFGFDSALKVVNSALLVKSNEESLATLDIACVDLFTGKCELFKAGAPASFILKGRAITKCELTSMPAGILRGIEFAKRTAVLTSGDKIVLMSDGITDLGDEWLRQTLGEMQGDEQECAEYILDCAMKSVDKGKMDDMSVIFATLERN